MKIQRGNWGLDGKPTLGVMVGNDGGFSSVTLERPHDDPKHPCIPAGTYRCYRDMHHPGKPGSYEIWELDTSHLVPKRDQVQIHILNRVGDSEGCIGPGENVAADRLSIEHSKSAFDRFMLYTQGKTEIMLEIFDPPAGA